MVAGSGMEVVVGADWTGAVVAGGGVVGAGAAVAITGAVVSTGVSAVADDPRSRLTKPIAPPPTNATTETMARMLPNCEWWAPSPFQTLRTTGIDESMAEGPGVPSESSVGPSTMQDNSSFAGETNVTTSAQAIATHPIDTVEVQWAGDRTASP